MSTYAPPLMVREQVTVGWQRRENDERGPSSKSTQTNEVKQTTDAGLVLPRNTRAITPPCAMLGVCVSQFILCRITSALIEAVISAAQYDDYRFASRIRPQASQVIGAIRTADGLCTVWKSPLLHATSISRRLTAAFFHWPLQDPDSITGLICIERHTGRQRKSS